MKKSRTMIKLDNLLSDKYFEQVCNTELLKQLKRLRDYEYERDYQSHMRLRIKKVNKLRNAIQTWGR